METSHPTRKLFETLGEEGKSSALETVIREYKKGLGIAEEEETDDDIEILTAPKQASMDELAGSDILPASIRSWTWSAAAC